MRFKDPDGAHRTRPLATTTIRTVLGTVAISVAMLAPSLSEEEEPSSSTVGTPLTSHLPESGLGGHIAERLDLSCFRNSIAPRREPGQRLFSAFGLAPTKTSETAVEFDTENWFYAVEVVRRGDENRDGLEDLVIRFIDDSKIGSYDTRTLLLVTQFEPDGNLIALAYTPRGSD